MVQEAIDRVVDAVVITGDIADRENRYFEAYGAFEDGAERLVDANIPIVAVSGNHDFDVLPRIIDGLDLDGLHFLGNDGSWDRWTLERDGESVAHFDGWSFPDEHVHTSPLDDYDLTETSVPQIGVLHADLDERTSTYAPVQSNDLRNTPMTAWLLGHIHSPGVRIDADPLVLYPGSPQPLYPGEPEAHGPWLLTLDAAGTPTLEQLPLASVRYDQLEIDVTGADDPQAITPTLSDALSGHVNAINDVGALKLFLAHIRLTGRTDAHSALVDERQSIVEQLASKEGSVDIRINSIEVDTRPAIDLEARAQGEDAVASLAALLLDLESGDPSDEYDPLIADSLQTMRSAHDAGAYNVLRRETALDRPDRTDAIDMLAQEARMMLNTLIQQKEDDV